MAIKAIDTSYKGYLFRSRLEARWAVFFDALGVEWEYEKEGYDLGGVYYLPDFYLPAVGWIEIKGTEPTDKEQNIASLLSAATGKPVYMFFGNIPDPTNLERINLSLNPRNDSAFCLLDEHGWDNDYMWCRCRTCGKLGIEWSGLGDRICRHDATEYPSYDDRRLVAAYAAARSARFEYGDQGAVAYSLPAPATRRLR